MCCCAMLIKLINKNQTNWDKHLSMVLLSYQIAYKVVIVYIPYQLMYGLHPMMPIKCVMSKSLKERQRTNNREIVLIFCYY